MVPVHTSAADDTALHNACGKNGHEDIKIVEQLLKGGTTDLNAELVIVLIRISVCFH